MGGTEPKGAGSAHLHRVTAVIARRETPGPIPNPEAKPLSADGTATARSWESRTPPNTTSQSSHPQTKQTGGGLTALTPLQSFDSFGRLLYVYYRPCCLRGGRWFSVRPCC